jgi:hypothetical protein
MTTLYDMLDVQPDDDAGTVKEAFRKAVKISHPDLNTADPDAPARFMGIVRANAILSDPELRAVYDRMLEFERRQHQAAYKIIPDAVVVVVLAAVMAGAYTLYTNLPEMSVYLPRISMAKIKAAADTAGEPARATTVEPSPPVEARIIERPSDKVESAAVTALGAVALTQKDAVAAEDAAHEPDNAAAQPSPPADANTAGGLHDQHESAEAPAPAAVAPVADGGVAAKDVAPAPSAVAPPPTDRAIEATPANEPSPSPPVKDAQFYRQQGIASYRNGDLPVAIADFDLAIRLDPNLQDVYIDRGIVLYRLHQLDRAFADVAQAMRIEHSHRNEPPLPRVRPVD